MTVAILRFGGSNCDRDSRAALTDLDIDADIVWHGDGLPAGASGVYLPGGFSYGDYLRAGAIAARSPVLDAVRAAADDGRPVLGVCNGAQIGAEAGLVPGAFTVNRSGRFQCEHVHVRVETTDSRWTAAYDEGEVLELPIAHAEGRFEIDDDGLSRLRQEDRVLLRYCEPDGTVSEAANPNGSRDNVAGVLGASRNVAVLMPHPERATLPDVAGVDGQGVLRGFS
ncbi:MAG: phosphoribosylformylglycinamidine synthase I [Halobacteriales archaeon]